MKRSHLIRLLLFFIVSPLCVEAQEKAWQYLELANALETKEKYEESRRAYRQAIDLYILESKWDSTMLAYRGVIYTYYSEGNYPATLHEFDKIFALHKTKNIALSAELGNMYTRLAYSNKQMDKPSEALRNYEKAIKVYNSIHYNDENVAYAYQKAAMLLMQKQDYEKTIRYLKEGLKSDSLKILNASIYGQLANCNLHIPNIKEAIKNYQWGIKSYEKKREKAYQTSRARYKHEVKVALLHSIGADAYFADKDFVQAEAACKKSYVLLKDKEKREWDYLLILFISWAKIKIEQKDYTAAANYFQKALDLKTKHSSNKSRSFANLFCAISGLYFKLGDYEKALDFSQQALQQIFPNFNENNPLFNPPIKAVYPEPWIMTAADRKGQALMALYQENKNPDYLKSATECYELVNKTRQEQQSTYNSESAKYYIGDYAHIYNERAIDAYYEWYQFNQKTDHLEGIFTLMESSKAAVLKEALQKNKAILLANIPDTLLQKEQDWRVRISNIRKNIALEQLNLSKEDHTYAKDSLYIENLRTSLGKEEENHQQFLQELKENYPEFERAIEQVEQASIAGVQRKLSTTGGTMLEYFAGTASIYLLVINAQKTKLFKIDRTPKLDQDINQLLAYFQSAQAIVNAPEDYLTHSQQLFQQLFPNGWEELADGESLILIPDGRLEYLPFEAFVTERSGEGMNLSTAAYLLRKHTITYAFSAALFLFEETTEKGSELLMLAPGFLNGERGQIPLAHSQATDLLPEGKTLSGATANLQNFIQEAKDSKIIHLSTHASANPQTNIAQIEFADTTMYLPQIYGLNLKADLVVLDACESGTGKIEKGEGVLSLGRAFRYAGAANIISSLWKVNEVSTAEIFTDFYDQVRRGTKKASALRQAKLHYLDQTGSELKKSPYYWSSFVYFGKDEVLDLKMKSKSGKWTFGIAMLLIGLFFMQRFLLSSRM